MPGCRLLAHTVLALVVGGARAYDEPALRLDQNDMWLHNLAGTGRHIFAFWVNEDMPEGHPEREVQQHDNTDVGIPNGHRMAIRTFNTHMFHFGLRKQPGSGTIMHRNNGEHEVLTFTVDEKGELQMERVPAGGSAESVRKEAEAACAGETNKDECVIRHLSSGLAGVKSERYMMNRIREGGAHQLRKLECAASIGSPKSVTVDPLFSNEWELERDEGHTSIRVSTFFNSSRAGVQLLRDFVSPAQCQALRAASEGLMTPATFAKSVGTSELGEARKAHQAVVYEGSSEPLKQLRRNLFSFLQNTDLHGGSPEHYNVEDAGQERMVAIEYGEDGDQYFSHCDGSCDGLTHRSGGRTASMIMYCGMPEDDSGATTFSSINLKLSPSVGDAVFFRYVGADGLTDDGVTLHSGCALSPGSKKFITTMWFRRGVSEADPEGNFDPSGVRNSDSVPLPDEDEVAQEAGAQEAGGWMDNLPSMPKLPKLDF